ncbi:MAG: hypothetical protein GEV10_12810 [Streptosporangiales bacterium]|nr:hypothetical protein [Streptosporangiales bacterium]
MTLTVRLGTPVRTALAAVLAVPLLLFGASAQAAPTDATRGLFGTQDPAFDGAFRQSLSILALQAAGHPVPRPAIDWLVTQQCDDGGWSPYRADPAKPCVAKSEDSNSTAMAVQALASVGGLSEEVSEGVGWLTTNQNTDGGIGYNAGGASDTNSTALFVQALTAADEDPSATENAGKTPIDALLGLQLGCDAPAEGRGSFAFQAAKTRSELEANDIAAAAALFALSGQVLPVAQPGEGRPRQLSCGSGAEPEPAPDAAGPAAAAYLAGVLDDNKGTVPAQQGGGSDLGTTASAAIGLAAFGATDDANHAMAALVKGASTYTKGPDGKDAPAALANIVLAATATGQDPAKIADNAVERLAATGPEATTPTQSASLLPSPLATRAASQGGDSGGTGSWVALAVIGGIVLVGTIVLVGRRRENAE